MLQNEEDETLSMNFCTYFCFGDFSFNREAFMEENGSSAQYIKKPGNCENQIAPKLVAPEDNKMTSTSKHSAEKQDTHVLKLKKRRCIDFLAGVILLCPMFNSVRHSRTPNSQQLEHLQGRVQGPLRSELGLGSYLELVSCPWSGSVLRFCLFQHLT